MIRATRDSDPETLREVVALFEDYATGNVSIAVVASKAGLHPDRVRVILANPIYNRWVRRYRRSQREERLPAAWRSDPPVSDTLWERVQSNLYRRTRGHAPRKRRFLDLLSGLLFCVCGRRIRANGQAGTSPRRQRLHPGTCDRWGAGSAVFASVHDDPIAAQVAGIRIDDVTVERVVRALRDDETPAPPTLDAARHEKQKRDLALEHAAGNIEDATYLARMSELRNAAPPRRETVTVEPRVAVEYLRDLPRL